MKIKENYLHEALKTDKKDDKPSWKDDVRRPSPPDNSETASKIRRSDAPLKDEMKFASLLDAPAKLPKPNQQRQDSGDERRDEQKSEAKHEAREKDVAENAVGDGRTENYESAGGQTGGQSQSGFGMNGQVGGLHLNDNFAARSILHIADLERLVSTVRTQINLGGKREITLQLKRSVLEGLQIKITTGDDAKVQIEFLAANENVRSQIEKHSEELAGILRGRGVDLDTLKTSVESDSLKDDAPNDAPPAVAGQTRTAADAEENSRLTENTFEPPTEKTGKVYNA